MNLNQLKTIKELGVDTIVDSNNWDDSFASGKALLIKAQNKGIRVMLHGTRLDSAKEINFLKDFKSLYRFYVRDEPKNFEQIDSVAKDINLLNSAGAAPGIATVYNDFNLIDYYYKNVNSKEVLIDHYPLTLDTPTSGNGLQQKFDELTQTFDKLSGLSKTYNRPFWFFVQAHSWSDLRDPTPKEIRAMTYLSLAYGAKGIFYFYYWTDPRVPSVGLVDINFQPNAKYYEVQKINQEIRKIRDILINLENVGTCNSKVISQRNKGSYIAGDWSFDKGWNYESSVNSDGSLELSFDGEKTNSLNQQDIWFDFHHPAYISTEEDKIIEIDYEILSNPKNSWIYFNPKREDRFTESLYLPKGEGRHTYITNLKNLKGTGNINKIEFFIDNSNQGNFKVKINSIKDYTCELPYVVEATENVEVGNFVHQNGDKYLFLVNRDTNNHITTEIKLDGNSLPKSYLLDVLTGKKIYSDSSDDYSFHYDLETGDGRLVKIVPLKTSFLDDAIAFFRSLF